MTEHVMGIEEREEQEVTDFKLGILGEGRAFTETQASQEEHVCTG